MDTTYFRRDNKDEAEAIAASLRRDGLNAGVLWAPKEKDYRVIVRPNGDSWETKRKFLSEPTEEELKEIEN